MPGARMFSTVTMMLMAPMMDEAPRMCTAKMLKSMPGPICSDSGAYMVQPAALAPPGTKNDTVNRIAPMGNSQKLKLFIRAKAMSRSEEHTSELQSLMRISYAVFCLKKKKTINK